MPPEIAEHLVGGPRYSMAFDTAALAEEEGGALLLIGSQSVLVAARELIDGRVGKDQRKLKLRDHFAKHIKIDRSSMAHLWKEIAEERKVGRDGVESSQHLRADGVVITREIEPSHFHAFRRRDECLGDEQVRQIGKAQGLGWGKLKPGAVIERVIRKRRKPRIPHQIGIEGGVDGHRRAALITRSAAIRADDAIVVDADGDGLSVAESTR